MGLEMRGGQAADLVAVEHRPVLRWTGWVMGRGLARHLVVGGAVGAWPKACSAVATEATGRYAKYPCL
ncbi:UNVERIFIED_CONTAM: hypothetical protein K2H54_042768 [Gekko kuhli]